VRSERSQSEKEEVSPLELLFDLVFVFALSQLSHHLLDNLLGSHPTTQPCRSPDSTPEQQMPQPARLDGIEP
jgi:hypothetical protein